MTQSEAQLEENLVSQLAGMGYERVHIPDSAALEANLKTQLEKHNQTSYTNAEFEKILNHLNKGNVFERAKTLRDRMELTRDDGTNSYVKFLDSTDWCLNQYQVTHQITVEGRRQNRYDVTILINGLPLVQIELKRRGMEIKEAFNQINRYQRDSYGSRHGLFQYVQLFIISNGVNTKYYANNRKQSIKQTFFWADENNQLITQLDDFADTFLKKCHVSKMICKYIVLHQSNKILMVLRPYQYYAVEKIVERVKNSNKNGYIWHTTGSGKTLTSFKAAQLLTELPTVPKVIFVVDRADLDHQTKEEFNAFSEGSVDGTSDTKALVQQLSDETDLIVTTIQKLNSAISKNKHAKFLENLQDKPLVFIFDECHRSQFGDTHKNIVKFFPEAQLFGFTGTPIFKDNAIKNQTTKTLFDEELHSYVITNAIKDQNVLKFSVEYWGTLTHKDNPSTDTQVSSIDTKAFFEHEKRLESIVDWIITNHDRKTHNRDFSSIFCVSNVDVLIKYYEIFQRKKEAGEHDLGIATIFTYKANEEDPNANGLIEAPDFDVDSGDINNSSRDKLEKFVTDYNAMYSTHHSIKDSKSFYKYYEDIAKRMKDREKEGYNDARRTDILLVVNMFLTGFDAKKLNTLYVDKNLKYHGLIQAYSRTNRILNEKKSQGNIVVFRNLKPATDDALRLYSDSNANEEVFLEPYQHYVDSFNEGVAKLKEISTTPNDVNNLFTEEEQLEFVKTFRGIIRELNVIQSFTEFTFDDLDMPEQEFADFKSKYLDIYDSSRQHSSDAPVSIINEVDFELELIQRDEINVGYIIKLLEEVHRRDSKLLEPNTKHNNIQKILNILGQEPQLRSKQHLIEKFIKEYMPTIPQSSNLQEAFGKFWEEAKEEALEKLIADEKMHLEGARRLISDYLFSAKEPTREDVLNALEETPGLLKRKKVYERIVDKLKQFIHTFEDDIGI